MRNYAGKLFESRGRDETFAFDAPLMPRRETDEDIDDRLAVQAVRAGCTTVRAIARYIGRPALTEYGMRRTAESLERLRQAGKLRQSDMGWQLA